MVTTKVMIRFSAGSKDVKKLAMSSREIVLNLTDVNWLKSSSADSGMLIPPKSVSCKRARSCVSMARAGNGQGSLLCHDGGGAAGRRHDGRARALRTWLQEQ